MAIILTSFTRTVKKSTICRRKINDKDNQMTLLYSPKYGNRVTPLRDIRQKILDGVDK